MLYEVASELYYLQVWVDFKLGQVLVLQFIIVELDLETLRKLSAYFNDRVYVGEVVEGVQP